MKSEHLSVTQTDKNAQASGGKPSALRRAHTSVRGGVWVGCVALVSLFFGLGGWMAFTPISGAIIALGHVAVKGEAKTIQHLDGGIVVAIDVKNGDVVHKGATLLRIDDTLLKANLEIYRTRLAEALAEETRLKAERDGATQITWPEARQASFGVVLDQNIRLSQQKFLDVRRDSRRGQLEQLQGKIAQYNNQIAGVRGLIASKRQQVALIEQELSGLKTLYKAGNTTLNRLLGLQRQKAQLLGQQAEHDAQLARIANLIGETKIQIVQVDREFREKVLAELRKTERDVKELVQQFHATRERLKRVVIRAPVDGMIHQLQVFTVGGVIQPGAAVMQIVPTQEAVDIVVQIAPQFIDEVRLNQKTVLRFSALGQQDSPEVAGTIRSVSPSTVVDEPSGQRFYLARIEVPPEGLKHIGGRARLVAGMPVDAFIQRGSRTVLSYLTKPLSDQVARAFRER